MGIQVLLVLIALACVPCMLVVKTMVLRRQHLWKMKLVCQPDSTRDFAAAFDKQRFFSLCVIFFFLDNLFFSFTLYPNVLFSAQLFCCMH